MVTANNTPIENFTTINARVAIVGVSQTSFEDAGPSHRPTDVVIRTSIGVADPKTGRVSPLAFVFSDPKQLDWLIKALSDGRVAVFGPVR